MKDVFLAVSMVTAINLLIAINFLIIYAVRQLWKEFWQ